MKHLLPLVLLAGCPLPKEEEPEDSGEARDTDDTDDSGWTGYAADSTLCGVIASGECAALPGTVEVYSIVPGQTACDECYGYDTGGSWEEWRDVLVGDFPVEAGGYFQANLPAGEYGAVTNWGECTACAPVTIEEDSCATPSLTGFVPEYADAPNIYLYPRRAGFVHVGVGDPDKVVASDPPYPEAGWRTWARPDGLLRTSQGYHDYLFYEYRTDPLQLQRDEGWCVEGPQAVASMEAAMDSLGFNPDEIGDFSEYWDEAFPAAAVVTVYPQQRDLPPLSITPRPDHLLRAWFLVEDGCAEVEEPTLTAVPRKGFHASEWGVVLGDDLDRMAPILAR